MLEIYFIATIWLALAILATILANRFKMSMALMKICIGAIAGYATTYLFGSDSLKADSDWLKFIAGTGAIILTFLAGAELDPVSLKAKIKESSVIGFIGFSAPFIGCTLLARFALGRMEFTSLFIGWDSFINHINGCRVCSNVGIWF
jgi:Kef-type K+ transport system membrane component KefB